MRAERAGTRIARGAAYRFAESESFVPRPPPSRARALASRARAPRPPRSPPRALARRCARARSRRCVAAALYLAFLFRSNSVAVLVDLTAERERNWQAEVASQNARMRAQQREIRKLRLRAGHGAESDDDDGAGAKEA